MEFYLEDIREEKFLVEETISISKAPIDLNCIPRDFIPSKSLTGVRRFNYTTWPLFLRCRRRRIRVYK